MHSTMLMSRRNRGKAVCAWGCCDTAHSGNTKRKARRAMKRRERRAWMDWN